MPLHPDAVAFAERTAALYAAEGIDTAPPVTVETRRRMARASLPVRAPAEWPPLAEIRDVPVPTRAGPRMARIFRPDAPGPLPVILYFHGGGYVAGGIAENSPEAHRLAAAQPALVVSFSYRLAPEDPFPAGVDDGEDALGWLAANAASLGADPARIALSGSSAGAGLAAAVIRRSLANGGPAVRLAILLSPWLDVFQDSASARTFATGYGLETAALDAMRDLYLAGRTAPDDPHVSPARHPLPAGWPATVLLAAECDPLADDARAFARRLAVAGVDHVLRFGEGMPHIFHGGWAAMPATAPHVEWLDREVRARL
jgi:acetyl esterase